MIKIIGVMKRQKLPILNGKVVSRKDFRKICDALSVSHTIGGRIFLNNQIQKDLYVNLIPDSAYGQNHKNTAIITQIMNKYNVTTVQVRMAVSTGWLPNLYQYEKIVRMLIENDEQRTQYQHLCDMLKMALRQSQGRILGA